MCFVLSAASALQRSSDKLKQGCFFILLKDFFLPDLSLQRDQVTQNEAKKYKFRVTLKT